MKRFRIFASISILSLAFGACTIGSAQGHHDKDKQDKQQDKHQDRQQDRDYQRHEDHGQSQRGQNQYHQPPGQQDRYHADNGRHLGQQKQMERAWQERRATHWEGEHRGWRERGGYHGYRVPDEYFRVHYGHDHFFRVYGLPFAYEGGNPRFQYGGRWFTVVDPYPEYWGPNWYQTDDVYVDYYGDGYYLFNRRYPGRPGIAININF